jgi:hypothetical protein
VKGRKQSHLPALSPFQIYQARAVLAVALGTLLPRPQIPDIRAILRCHSPEEVRRLLARGFRLIKQDGKGRKS